MKKMAEENLLDKISALAKRRGFIYPGSEIYGGIAGFYDFGPLGTELKFNIKQAWWRDTVQLRGDVVGLSAAIIMNPKVWEASGHVSGFTDLLIECPKCHKRFKADEFEDEKKMTCPGCGAEFEPKAKQFNLMFKTHVGPVEDSSSLAYLRPETAGGIFVNFKNVVDTMRVKIPFGIAQIGKAFRNEINPKDFIFRTREFEQMEVEYFVRPGEDEKYLKNWVKERVKWYEAIGLKSVRTREQSKEERAHYSKATTDVEYKFPFGWQEIEGIANRGDFDLKAHAKTSGKDLTFFDEDAKGRFTPYVIEPSAGVDRIALALLCEAYTEEKDRVVLKLHPRIAPYKAAVFPLLGNKPQLTQLAKKIYNDLKKEFVVAWDERGNIGKRYYSQDEIGTPFCITVDFESLEKNDVTVRDRDTTKQVRVKVGEVKEYIKKEPRIEVLLFAVSSFFPYHHYMSDLKRVVLKNGLRLILVPQPQSLATTVLVAVEAGSKYETKDINGLSHFLEHMCFKGTKNRPQHIDIASELDGLGAQYNASTSQESTSYYAKAKNESFDKILEIVADLYLNPLFPADEIEKEKGVIIGEINMYEDLPQRKVSDLFMELLYGDQPAGWDIAGRKEVIRRLTRDDFVKYRGKHYLPPATALVVAGGFDQGKVQEKAEKYFGEMPAGTKEGKLKVVEAQEKPQEKLFYKETDQTHLILGFRAFSIFDKRKYALNLLADILGGSMSSRLFQKIREEMGAGYYVGAYPDFYSDHGIVAMAAGVHHEMVKQVIQAGLGEFVRIRDEKVGEEELQRAKDHLTGNLLLSVETSDALGYFYGAQEIIGLPLKTPKEAAEELQKVTAEEVQGVSQNLFQDGGLNLALIGPFKGESFSDILKV